MVGPELYIFQLIFCSSIKYIYNVLKIEPILFNNKLTAFLIRSNEIDHTGWTA